MAPIRILMHAEPVLRGKASRERKSDTLFKATIILTEVYHKLAVEAREYVK